MSGPDYNPAVHADRDERVQALRIGASVLKDRWPQVQAAVIIWIGPNQQHAYASLQWPGVIRVTLRYTGRLVAQSLPGKPDELDEGQI